jgi:hypothetical protein
VSAASFATASTRLAQGSVVDICAGLAARHSARTPAHLTIDSNTVARPSTKFTTLSVEGLNKSTIARVKQIAWNIVARWLEKAAHSSRRFNNRKVVALSLAELQADEIRTVVGSKKHPIWIFTTI